MRVFGPDTAIVTELLADWVRRRIGDGLTLFLHGRPDAWDLLDWPGAGCWRRREMPGSRSRW